MDKVWKAIYKCRLCGEMFEKEAYVLIGFDAPTNATTIQHHCCDGSVGIADNLGSRQVEIEECLL